MDRAVARARAARLFVTSFCVALAVALACPQAMAQDAVAGFYRGKTITIDVGFTAGGGYDLHARTLGRYLGRHLPGNPNVIIKNMPGAAGLILLNSLYNTLPRDGTEMATFDRALPLEPLTNPQRARFDALKLNWIGSTDDDASTCFAWHTSPVKTFNDLYTHQLIVGGTGTGGDAHDYPMLMNAVLGTKFKVVPGYPGSAQVMLAIERGEVEGFCSMGFVTMQFTRPKWVENHLINVLVQLAVHKNKDHPEVPLGMDLAKTPADRQAIEFLSSPNLFARPFVAPPDVPPERVRALRQAFNDTMADPDYLADATARKMHVVLVKGEEIERVLRHIYGMPKSVIDRVREAVK
jgi:tripartite-type tricarboxylate transporter receptor subunit TctC